MLMPSRVKYRKPYRRPLKGRAKGGATVAFGEYGLQSLDCAWITAMRTGAANAVAMKYLGPASPRTVAVVGCGVQGRSNLLAMLTRYPGIVRVCCYDVIPQALVAFIRDAESSHAGVEFVAAAGPRESSLRPAGRLSRRPDTAAPPSTATGAWPYSWAAMTAGWTGRASRRRCVGARRRW